VLGVDDVVPGLDVQERVHRPPGPEPGGAPADLEAVQQLVVRNERERRFAPGPDEPAMDVGAQVPEPGARRMLVAQLGEPRRLALVPARHRDRRARPRELGEVRERPGGVPIERRRGLDREVQAHVRRRRTGAELVDLGDRGAVLRQRLEHRGRAEDAARIGRALEVAPPLLGDLERLADDRERAPRQQAQQVHARVARAGGLGAVGDDLRGVQGAVRAHGLQIDLADRLDLVPEEIEAQRGLDGLGGPAPRRGDRAAGGEDVEDPPAQREVPGLLDGVQAAVAGVGEPPGERGRIERRTDLDRSHQAPDRRRRRRALHRRLDRARDHGRAPAEIRERPDRGEPLRKQVERHGRLARERLERRDADHVPPQRRQLGLALVRVVEVREQQQHRPRRARRDARRDQVRRRAVCARGDDASPCGEVRAQRPHRVGVLEGRKQRGVIHARSVGAGRGPPARLRTGPLVGVRSAR
jgi:hypothetical protein